MRDFTENRKPCFLKVVYFDEGSAMDYLEAKHGGRYDKVSSDIVQRVKKIAGEVGVEASTDPKILSFVVDSLLGIKGKVAGNASYGRTGDNKVSETLSSTVLSNFIDEVYGNSQENQEKPNRHFGIYNGIRLSFIPKSVTFIKMISPMLKIIKEESFGEDMPLQLGALDQIFNDAKGYYELVTTNSENRPEKVFRFNINALRNNYRLNDLTKMEITVIGIKVGKCTVEELEWESEFDERRSTESKDTGKKSAFGELLKESEGESSQTKVEDEVKLSVYDVILAGVADYEY